MSIFEIIQELNQENGSNYKLYILTKYQSNELLKRVLKMTYDKVVYTYGMSLKKLEEHSNLRLFTKPDPISLENALDLIESKISSREITGNAALDFVSNLMYNLSFQDREIVKKIIDRDLKINIGRTQINKVFKNLIVKPVYMRCDVYGPKTKTKINPKNSVIQLKADGTYREFVIRDSKVDCNSRSGEEYDYPLINAELQNFPNGNVHGELTVILTDELLTVLTPKIQKIDKKNGTNNLEEITEAFEQHKSEVREYILPRSIGNGLINSDEVPHEFIKLELWDFVTPEEMQNAKNKVKNKTPYSKRFNDLIEMVNDLQSKRIFVIPHVFVSSIKEALEIVSKWMNMGYEGGVLKDLNMVFRDGTSPQQLKLKLCIDIEVRCVGYNEGRKGSKREGKIGSLQFMNDEGTIRGSCSGFSDEQLDEFTQNFDKYKNQIMTVQFNDLSKARGNDFFALSHPRFIEWRTDKNETDALEQAFKLREMAMLLS